jgi:hypothetical protein
MLGVIYIAMATMVEYAILLAAFTIHKYLD